MTESSLQAENQSTPDLSAVFRRLKERGCALLVAGEAPEATYQQAARELHGTTEERRLRIQTITGEEPQSEPDAWLPGDVSSESENTRFIDFRTDQRGATTPSTQADSDPDVISPMRAGPSFPGVSGRASTVRRAELSYEERCSADVDIDEINWEAAARPVPSLRGKRSRKVKPQGVTPSPTEAEVEELEALRETLTSAIDEFGRRAESPGELRLGISSIAPLVRTFGERRIQFFLNHIRTHVIDNNGLMFCQFPHPITSPEGSYLREQFDATVIVRRSIENGLPHVYLRYVIPAQNGVTDETLITEWYPYGPNQREHTIRGE